MLDTDDKRRIGCVGVIVVVIVAIGGLIALCGSLEAGSQRWTAIAMSAVSAIAVVLVGILLALTNVDPD